MRGVAYVHRHLTTIVVAAAVAAVTAGGPAVAATVVDFAKNAGAVDGLSAVKAGAPAAALKGKLVATNPNTGKLPGSVIGTAPNAARLAGVPVAGFAPSLVDARDYPMVGKTFTAVCRTPLLIRSGASVATVSGDLTIAAGSSESEVLMVLLVSQDGGSTFDAIDDNWYNVVEVDSDITIGTAAHTSVATLKPHAQVVFAMGVVADTGTGFVNPAVAECSVSATVDVRTPGTVVRRGPSTPPMMGPMVRRAPTFAQLLGRFRSAGAAARR